MSAQVGKDRERQLARWFRERGHVAYTTKNDGNKEWKGDRLRASHGIVDVIAFTHHNVLLMQVKTTAGGPYERFGPDERAKLAAEAVKVRNAVPYLVWWPPRQREPCFIPASEWPARKVNVA